MHLFLDTNIYLSFYHYTSDDLEELRKLGVLIETGEVTLHVPDQVAFEFRRNREVKYADALSKFKKESLDKNFPQIMQAYNEDYKAMREAIESYGKAKSQLLEKLEADYIGFKLKADEIILDLFEKAGEKKVSSSVLKAAQVRMMRRNPPGKDGSHGDAINWEHLLENIPEGEEFYLIAYDKDWRDKGNDDYFSSFLSHEWKESKNKEIGYYRSLSSFFKDKYPDIKVSTELEKELLIKRLGNSGTFKTSRSVLKSLTKFSDFTEAQIREIAEAATTNNQIYWIGEDADVRHLIQKLLGDSLDLLEPKTQKKIRHYFKLVGAVVEEEEAGENQPPAEDAFGNELEILPELAALNDDEVVG